MRRTAILLAVLGGLAIGAALFVSPAVEAQNYGGYGPLPVTWTNPVRVDDDEALAIGDGSDFSCVHDATDTVCTSATGNFVLDNTDVDDPTVLRLGTDTSATSVVIENNGGEDLLTVRGDGAVLFGPDALRLDVVNCATTVGAESTDTIAVTVACTDSMGDATGEIISLEAILLCAGVACADTVYEVAETGAGDLVYEPIDDVYIEILTSSGGAATLTISDVAGGTDDGPVLLLRGAGSYDGIFVTGVLETGIAFDDVDSSP